MQSGSVDVCKCSTTTTHLRHLLWSNQLNGSLLFCQSEIFGDVSSIFILSVVKPQEAKHKYGSIYLAYQKMCLFSHTADYLILIDFYFHILAFIPEVEKYWTCWKSLKTWSYNLISLYPDEWRDFHDCGQDFLQSLSEGDQEAPCHVSTHQQSLNYLKENCFMSGFRSHCMKMVWWHKGAVLNGACATLSLIP